MKKFLIAGLLTIPLISLAAPLDETCPLQSTCSMKIWGKLNKRVHTYNILPNKIYRCVVLSGNGGLFNLSNIQASPGVSVSFASRLNQPFEMTGSNNGNGAVSYTVHNNGSIFRRARLSYRCDLQAR